MKRITSHTVQSMFVYWLGYLAFLVLMHILRPDDPWNKVFFSPGFLIVVPLLVACIPLLLTKSERGVPTDDVEDENGWNRLRGTRRINSNTGRRMLLAWVVSLVTFASPLRVWTEKLYPFLHRPLFLIIAPLVVACIPLLYQGTVPARCATAEKDPFSRGSFVWRGIIGCSIGVLLLIGALFLINSLPHNKMSSLWPNVLFGGTLLAAILRILYFIKRLRSVK